MANQSHGNNPRKGPASPITKDELLANAGSILALDATGIIGKAPASAQGRKDLVDSLNARGVSPEEYDLSCTPVSRDVMEKHRASLSKKD